MRFALTIFLSAFLLFQVQPLMGRYILPWFGGTPAVWTTCMLLFQVLLLAGYAYAHALASWFSPRRQAAIHLFLLVASLAFLPVIPNESWKPQGNELPALHILGLLGATTGMPYLLLSSTGPLLQSWFSRAYPGRSPYRLYALSNVGSLLALLSYPVAFEPWFRLRDQAWGWSIGFALFVVACGWTAVRLLMSQPADGSTAPASDEVAGLLTTHHSPLTSSSPATWQDIAFWLAASACGSMLLLATTNQMCQEVPPIPFLWILPLSLYLLTFIISFDRERWYHRAVFGVLWLLGATAAVGVLYGGPKLDIWLQVGGLALGLFSGCMLCHGELVRSKPSARQLTLFYLTISAGGALGGFLVAVVAPVLFTGYWEIHIALELTSLVVCWAWFRDPRSLLQGGQAWWAWAPLVSVLIVQQVFLSKNILDSNDDVVDRTRNFFGVLRVKEYPVEVDESIVELRSLVHGNILHGVQFVDDEWGKHPTTYYASDSGVGVAIANHSKRKQDPHLGMHIGVVGLGTGTMASWVEPQDHITFYEINPEVVRLCDQWFTYRKPSAMNQKTEKLVMGDARIQLEKQAAAGDLQGFDVLVVDAFSSDAIPMHLLTLESVQLYQRHLAPDGILCIHVSNNHFNLIPVVRGLADAVGMQARWIYGRENDDEQISSCSWVLLTNNQEFLNDELAKLSFLDWSEDEPQPLVWTDDYGALWQILNKDLWEKIHPGKLWRKMFGPKEAVVAQ